MSDLARYLEVERMSRLGRLGERLAEERLAKFGFTEIKNLNEGMNFPFADIVASRGQSRYLIGVKTRNEYQSDGKINPTYNAILIRKDKNHELKILEKTELEITHLLWEQVRQLADKFNATPAWVAVATRPERNSYSAYFGLAEMIKNRRSIPMKLNERTKYELLAEHEIDLRLTADLLNRKRLDQSERAL
jgi:hypothetical protein